MWIDVDNETWARAVVLVVGTGRYPPPAVGDIKDYVWCWRGWEWL